VNVGRVEQLFAIDSPVSHVFQLKNPICLVLIGLDSKNNDFSSDKKIIWELF
jgi:hypothetical protein